MAKIKCPHCGANNQDVTEKDRCWQCEAVLGHAPAPVAESAAPATPVTTQFQKQVEPAKPAPRPTEAAPQGLTPAGRIAIAIIVLLILIAIVFFMMKK